MNELNAPSDPPDEMVFAPFVDDCWFLTGATATGKTSIGVELAEQLGAEIISLDSMAIYRNMDVGTDKPASEMRQRVPHHLIDIREPTEEFSISDYFGAARGRVTQIRDAGKEVLFVGGTPFYLKALLRGLYRGPSADWEFRRSVEEEADRVGVAALHERLAQVDPVTASRLHPRDKRRIIRALEVYKLTGQPISHFQLQFEEGRPADKCRVFVLSWPRKELHHRINVRVDSMFARGWVDEVQGLVERYGGLGRTASQAVGYREILRLVAGEIELTETIELVKARTRQFARRQETWFRSLSECRWIERTAEDSPAAVATAITRQAAEPTG